MKSKIILLPMSGTFNPVRKVFNLKAREYITPNYIRLTLTNEDISAYHEMTIGANNKIFLPPVGCDKVHFPRIDEVTKEVEPIDASLRPIMRTYTHRGIDIDKKEMYVDFVAHGDEGIASAFAIHAPIGAEIGLAMKGGGKDLVPPADWYMLTGDATAIPVLSAILEGLPATANVHALIEVISPQDVQEIKTVANATIEWLVNPTPGENSPLAARTKTIVNQNEEYTNRFGYFAAEYATIKELRDYFRKEKGWTKEEFYAYSYWKHGVAESVSEKDRREEKDREL